MNGSGPSSEETPRSPHTLSGEGTRGTRVPLVKASLTRLDTLETFSFLWNPQGYRVERQQHYVAPPCIGRAYSPPQFVAGGSERFLTRLFLDSTARRDADRDLRPRVDRIRSWSDTDHDSGMPPQWLFLWGSFRFRGYPEEFREEWTRFDPDGTPVRVWIDLVLRK